MGLPSNTGHSAVVPLLRFNTFLDKPFPLCHLWATSSQVSSLQLHCWLLACGAHSSHRRDHHKPRGFLQIAWTIFHCLSVLGATTLAPLAQLIFCGGILTTHRAFCSGANISVWVCTFVILQYYHNNTCSQIFLHNITLAPWAQLIFCGGIPLLHRAFCSGAIHIAWNFCSFLSGFQRVLTAKLITAKLEYCQAAIAFLIRSVTYAFLITSVCSDKLASVRNHQHLQFHAWAFLTFCGGVHLIHRFALWRYNRLLPVNQFYNQFYIQFWLWWLRTDTDLDTYLLGVAPWVIPCPLSVSVCCEAQQYRQLFWLWILSTTLPEWTFLWLTSTTFLGVLSFFNFLPRTDTNVETSGTQLLISVCDAPADRKPRGNLGPKSENPRPRTLLHLRCFWALVLFCVVTMHWGRSEGGGFAAETTKAPPNWEQLFIQQQGAKPRRPLPSSSYGQPWHVETKVKKRSLHRALRRAQRDGLSWYRGQCYTVSDFAQMNLFPQALRQPEHTHPGCHYLQYNP